MKLQTMNLVSALDAGCREQPPHAETRLDADATRNAGAAIHTAGIDAAPARRLGATRVDLTSDVAIGDWDVLLDAVKARLRSIAGEMPAGSTEPQQHTGVLECVAALDQLHTTLRHETGRRHRLEQDMGEARVSLERAREELLHTQAGARHARHLALHDSLTGLPNRSFFQERLAQALARDEMQATTLAVLYFDLDEFKPINDAHGHDAGDELLKIVAARLTRAVRSGDMVCRMGGDEFACLLESSPGRAQLNHLACKLLDAVSAPAQIGDVALHVRLSIGVALGFADGSTADALIRSADAAMYRAKRQKTGYAFFDETA